MLYDPDALVLADSEADVLADSDALLMPILTHFC